MVWTGGRFEGIEEGLGAGGGCSCGLKERGWSRGREGERDSRLGRGRGGGFVG